jgi:hypothetical protein
MRCTVVGSPRARSYGLRPKNCETRPEAEELRDTKLRPEAEELREGTKLRPEAEELREGTKLRPEAQELRELRDTAARHELRFCPLRVHHLKTCSAAASHCRDRPRARSYGTREGRRGTLILELTSKDVSNGYNRRDAYERSNAYNCGTVPSAIRSARIGRRSGRIERSRRLGAGKKRERPSAPPRRK